MYGGIPKFFDILLRRIHGVQGVAVIDIGKIHFSIILAEVAGIVQISGGVPHGLRGIVRDPVSHDGKCTDDDHEQKKRNQNQ